MGQTTGDIYQALTGGALEFTFINNFRLIGPGPDNNLQTHQTIHLTINANGVVYRDRRQHKRRLQLV